MRTTILLIAACLLTVPTVSAHIGGSEPLEPCDDDGSIHVHQGCFSVPGKLVLPVSAFAPSAFRSVLP